MSSRLVPSSCDLAENGNDRPSHKLGHEGIVSSVAPLGKRPNRCLHRHADTLLSALRRVVDGGTIRRTQNEDVDVVRGSPRGSRVSSRPAPEDEHGVDSFDVLELVMEHGRRAVGREDEAPERLVKLVIHVCPDQSSVPNPTHHDYASRLGSIDLTKCRRHGCPSTLRERGDRVLIVWGHEHGR